MIPVIIRKEIMAPRTNRSIVDDVNTDILGPRVEVTSSCVAIHNQSAH